MLKRGDVVKVRTKWLSPAEKADPKYANQIYFVLDYYNGRVDLVCESNNFLGHSRYTWAEETVYKVGEVDPELFK